MGLGGTAGRKAPGGGIDMGGGGMGMPIPMLIMGMGGGGGMFMPAGYAPEREPGACMAGGRGGILMGGGRATPAWAWRGGGGRMLGGGRGGAFMGGGGMEDGGAGTPAESADLGGCGPGGGAVGGGGRDVGGAGSGGRPASLQENETANVRRRPPQAARSSFSM